MPSRPPSCPAFNICIGFQATTGNAVRTSATCDLPNLIGKHNRSDRLTTTAPPPTIARFQPLPATDAQIASHCMTPKIDSYIGYCWDLDQSPQYPLAPIDVGTDWSATSSLVFPSTSADTLAMQGFNEGGEVNVPQSGSNYN